MAKRKRLTPALISGSDKGSSSEIESVSAKPPIAHIAAETASAAAFAEVADALTSAREEGRLITRLPLAEIKVSHLVRDRVAFDPADMAALKASLDSRGQQVPIEVVPLENNAEGQYGLISGLRRVIALREIGQTEVLALVRQPKNSVAAYLAMVEENEIRSGVSYYERARVASEAARLGLFETPHVAIAHLFGQASPAKRSKIGSFVTVHEALSTVLRFPAAIPERLGLQMAKALGETGRFAQRLEQQLRKTPPQSAEEERNVIAAILRGGTKKTSTPAHTEIAPGLRLERGRDRLVIRGSKLTDDLEQALVRWLRDQC